MRILRTYIVTPVLKGYYFCKHWLEDTMWGTHSHRVPAATALGSFLWFVAEPSPEPAVVFITAILAISVSKKQNNDHWYTKTQGNLYEITYRADTLSKEERVELAKSFVKNIDFLCKWKVTISQGDSPNQLYVDALIDDDKKLINQARQHFVVYYIHKNGKKIHEKEV